MCAAASTRPGIGRAIRMLSTATDMTDEAAAIRTGGGKWADPTVPKVGWVCVGIDDLGEVSETCEMCGTALRYVHTMKHNDYPRTLACGCICSGHMQEDIEDAHQRERKVKNRATSRQRFITHRGWYYWGTLAEKEVLDRYRGWKVTVYEKQDGTFAGMLERLKDGRQVNSKRKYATATKAKSGAFDAICWIAEHPL